MNESLKNQSDTEEISALVGELPTWSKKKTASQIGILLFLIGLIIYFTTSDKNIKTEDSIETPVVVSTDGPIIEHSGYRYQFGELGDMVAVRECSGTKLPWLLRVSTGELFRFDSWAKTNIKEASFIRQIEGASGITVIKDPVCDQLVINKSDADPLILAN
ncbi:MAG: hypothetical protein QGI12_00880 [Acidimicrobiales bacterium]|nr:hypothetical protein [Acidimicrobiales bacterium]